MPTPSASRSADLLIVAALLLSTASSACSSGNAAPPGVAADPTLVDDSGDGPEELDASAEQTDSSTRRDAGRADAGAPDARVDAAIKPSADAAPPDAGRFESDASSFDPGKLASVERLLVADGRTPRVYALDVPSQKLLETFTLSGQASVHAGPSGRFGYALEAEANTAHVINMGLLAQPQNAGASLTEPVQLLAGSISGLRPAAFSAQGSSAVTVFFAGKAELLSLPDDERAVTGRSATFAAGQPHTGFALGIDQRVLTTRDIGAGAELVLLDAKLQPQAGAPSLSCAGPGEAVAVAHVAAVSCNGGVLRFDASSNTSKLVSYPLTTTDASPRATRLRAHPDLPTFLALFEDRLCLVRDAFECVAQPAGSIVDLDFDPSGKRVVVLTGDGIVHFLVSDTLAEVSKLDLVTPVPNIQLGQEAAAVARGRDNMYVSDPQTSQVHVLDARTGKRVSSLSIPGGFPTKLAVFRYPQ